MKKFAIRLMVFGALPALGIIASSCKSSKSDPEIERQFQGDWRTEYYLGNKDMRMKVAEIAHFDTLTHRYKIDQIQELVFPVHIEYARVSYEGDWSADSKYLYGRIDAKTIKNVLNQEFEENKEYKAYYDFVKDEAETDLTGDEFFIRNIEDGRLHLYDDDRGVTHDLISISRNDNQ